MAILTKIPMVATEFQSKSTTLLLSMEETLFWRAQLQPIPTAAEITVHIKILPVHQPYLYQKTIQKNRPNWASWECPINK